MKFETLQQLYRYLGLSRQSHVWSWGVATDDFLLLQIWRDEVRRRDGRYFACLWRDRGAEYRSQGEVERLNHLEQIKGGKQCYFLICQAKDESIKAPRTMGNFHTSGVRVAKGTPFEDDGCWYQEYGDLLKMSCFRRRVQ